jgi:hypothetical protein
MSHITLRPAWAPRTALCFVGLTLFASSLAAATETPTTEGCMSFIQTPMDKSVEYRLENQCKRAVTCSIAWTLQCGDDPPFRKVAASQSARIAATKFAVLTASARACADEGWEITNVSWVCSPS